MENIQCSNGKVGSHAYRLDLDIYFGLLLEESAKVKQMMESYEYEKCIRVTRNTDFTEMLFCHVEEYQRSGNVQDGRKGRKEQTNVKDSEIRNTDVATRVSYYIKSTKENKKPTRR